MSKQETAREMKTIQTDLTMADLLMVLRALPEDEREVLAAFSGDEFDVDRLSLQLANAAQQGPAWTIRIEETGEPLVVGGMIQVGTSVWRTWFFANQRAFDDYGWEMSVHVMNTHRGLMERTPNLRIETMTLADRDPKVYRWYEFCGMTRESEMQGYGVNGETAVMYVSTNGEGIG